jgi:hypothetical protein
MSTTKPPETEKKPVEPAVEVIRTKVAVKVNPDAKTDKKS